ALRRPSSLLAFFGEVRIGAKIYAGFCLVLLLLVVISVASWLGFQETSDGMATSQRSSDAAIATAVMDGRTAKALYFAQKFMAGGQEEDATAARAELAGVREAATALRDAPGALAENRALAEEAIALVDGLVDGFGRVAELRQ